MMVLAGVAAAVVVGAGAAAVTAWKRRHRDRRDLEGHFQQAWEDQPRWADLADERSASDRGERSPGPV